MFKKEENTSLSVCLRLHHDASRAVDFEAEVAHLVFSGLPLALLQLLPRLDREPVLHEVEKRPIHIGCDLNVHQSFPGWNVRVVIGPVQE